MIRFSKRIKQYKFIFLSVLLLVLFIFFISSAILWFSKRQAKRENGFYLSSMLNNFLNDSECDLSSISSNGELRDLVLSFYYLNQSDSKPEYIELLHSIADNCSYSEITRSIAKLRFISLALNQGYGFLSENSELITQYLDSFQNVQQNYFTVALFLRILYYYRVQNFVLVKSCAENLMAMHGVEEFFREHVRIILTKVNLLTAPEY